MARGNFKKGAKPWNTGLRGEAAGWTRERREHQSRIMKQWVRDNPDHIFNQLTRSSQFGPDPEVRRHRMRFLRARAQAKYWHQEWTILWEDYLDLLKTAPGRWGRDGREVLHLKRLNTSDGWHIDNVKLMNRRETCSQPRWRDDRGRINRRRRRTPVIPGVDQRRKRGVTDDA